MAIVTINDEYLTDIADAIREKTNTEETYKPREMAAAIRTIEGYTEVISDGTVINCTNVQDYITDGVLTVPSNIQRINGDGDTYFQAMRYRDIKSIVIEDGGSKLLYIAPYTFRECKSLTSITITDRSVVFEDYSFAECTKLSSIKANYVDSTTDMWHFVRKMAFAGCSALTTISLYGQHESESISFNQNTRAGHYIIEPFGLYMTALESSPPRYVPPYGLYKATGTTLTFGADSSIDRYALRESSYRTLYIYSDERFPCIHPEAFSNSSVEVINVTWSEGEVAGAPWGATDATINYNYVAE